MNDAGKNIDHLLTGLRVAEPSPGMQRRILDAMQTHEVVDSATSWGWRSAVAMWPLGMAALLLVTITVRRHPPIVIHQTTSVVARHVATPLQVPIRAAKQKPRTHPQSVSFPAPPLPLTAQEKLLLRLAHGQDADNMAVLNPEIRAQQTAKANAEFQQFFAIDPKEMRSQIE